MFPRSQTFDYLAQVAVLSCWNGILFAEKFGYVWSLYALRTFIELTSTALNIIYRWIHLVCSCKPFLFEAGIGL